MRVRTRQRWFLLVLRAHASTARSVHVVTKRDYVAIAAAISKYRATLSPHVAFDRSRYAALRELANIFCEVFAEDNHRFDRGRFLTACGFEEDE